MKKQFDIKKLVLLNLPYLLMGLFATNFGEAWRLAQGTNASEKFLSLFAVLPGALQSFWPSLHPLDLLVGLCCGSGLRLAVYLKSKNAKKYRHGMEYGSARWGTREDIAPYIDPVFQNNVILTKTESLTMNSRPKDPKTARNKNVLVIGGSGSGKTRFWLKPNLMQMHSSYVVTDPKGTILVECGKMLQRGAPKLGKDGKPMKDKHGKVIYEPYRIKVLNTINFKKSMHYNPFAYTMKPTLDENGRLMLREDYRIATLNCGDEDFAVACMRSNLRYGKNQKREDVKSHHYIISFDPRDAVDNGLTVDRAQALGEEFCRKQFPGHQAIVCTHPDGHNHSGNIHVHIVINSLRIEEVPFLPYMDRPADTRAGCKHRCTDAAMEYFKAEVMELCHRENLYQIDLLHGSKNRITEREYWAQRKGQAKLDKEVAALPAEEQPAKPTKFETDKEKLRQAIRTALSSATSYGEFAAVLLQQGVTVKESRGRLSYLTPDRTKPITARKLGDDFDRAAVLALLEQNAHRAAEQTATVPEYPRNIRERLQGKKAVQTTPEKDGIQRMVDRAAKRAEGKGAGYDRWAAVHNLKQMAATVAAYGQYGYSPEELDAALVSANADLQDSTAKLKALDAAIREKKELQTQVLAYAKTKPARDGLKAQKTEKARSTYRERHESDFIIADAATRYFRAHGVSKLPSHKALQAEIEQLTAEKNAHYNEYREKKARVKELHTVKSNLSQILQGEKDREKKHEHER